MVYSVYFWYDVTISFADDNQCHIRDAKGAVSIVTALKCFPDDKAVLLNACAALWLVILDGFMFRICSESSSVFTFFS
jgi:hypothetical protein